MRLTTLALAASTVALAGCGQDFREIGREPGLSPPGVGLGPDAIGGHGPATRGAPRADGSLWDERRPELFRDPRARQVGDVMTVVISIDDKAKLDGTFDRSRTSGWGAAFDFLLGVGGAKREGNGEANWNSSTRSKGQGAVNRAETIRLSLAVVVSHVLPNGNLVITGTQEIRVNYELRVLQMTGIVRPGDISKDNTVPYDKIAEARISYGGRGRVMEVQQPGYGHQFLDRVFPF